MTKPLTAVDHVQAELIAAIQKEGIESVLNWIGGWYTKLAEAKLKDQLARNQVLFPAAVQDQGNMLCVGQWLVDEAQRTCGQGGQPGFLLLQQALIGVYARDYAVRSWQRQKDDRQAFYAACDQAKADQDSQTS